MTDVPKELQTQVDQALALEKEAGELITKLKSTQEQLDAFWDAVEATMIAENIKSMKGDWGSLTIAERINWLTTQELPAKFYKKVVDKKKLTDTFRLEGKAPKGATPSYTKHLTRRIK